MSKKATVTGIDAYPEPSRLHGCVNDAREFAALIKRNGNGAPNCDVHLETDVPTKSRLKSLIQKAFSGNSNIAIFYFSGHGYINESGGCIVTPDATAYDEGVPMDYILETANASDCRNRIIIVDSCFSGATGEPRIKAGVTTHIYEGVTILTACRKNEPAMEVDGHGVFTNLLLEALRGGAANLGGYITPGSIYAFIDQALGEHEQRPVFKTNITRFVSLREVTPPVSEEVLRKIFDYFPTPDYLYPLDSSHEFTNTEDWKIELVKPFADPCNVEIFKHLQKMASVGLVVPVNEHHMYFAAMKGKPCKLTPLGQHYWRLAEKGRI